MKEVKETSYEKRNIGIDILRIVSMYQIVMLHFLNLGEVLDKLKPGTLSAALIRFVCVTSLVSVNVFGIITGWLNCEKKDYKWNRIIELLLSVLFWCTALTVSLFPILHNQLTLKDFIIALFPALKGRYWYITSYVFVFFSMPYLNRVATSLDRNEFKKMLIILVVLLSVLPTFLRTDFFKLNNGMSPLWLIVCYFIGAYIKRYFNGEKISKEFCLRLFFLLAVCTLIWWMLTEYVTIRLFNEAKLCTFWTNSYYSPVLVVMAVAAVLWGTRIQCNWAKMKAIIIGLSDVTFGIYIIHCNILLWDRIIEPIIIKKSELVLSTGAICSTLVFMIGALVLFLFSALLEKGRILLFENCHIKEYQDNFATKMNRRFPL